MMRQVTVGLALSLALVAQAPAKEAKQDVQLTEHDALMDHGDGHLMDMEGGMIMGQNKDKLPGGCDKVAEDKEITVKAGRKYSKPGFVFGFDESQWQFKPCTRLKVNFINEDNVRHQWMMHGLPKYIYQKGMFHLEITGPAKITGTLILPKEEKTYLLHCDIAQHMEKGMKAQLKVGRGGGELPSIPGLTANALPDSYKADAPAPVPATVLAEQADALAAAIKAKGGDSESLPGSSKGPASKSAKNAKDASDQAQQSSGSWVSGMTILGIALGLFGAPYAWQRIQARSKGKDVGSYVAAALGLLKESAEMLLDMVFRLVRKFTEKK